MESKNVPQGIINYPIACYMVGIVLIGYLLIVVCAIIFVYLNIFVTVHPPGVKETISFGHF